eukprot:GHVQ01024987.1.p2 GENE.GHVQ01024987.1~~GHVQ01024987.1.p2  ORF type:complete len:107 (-),score=18.19 GHVQ01024987.1:642-962(-)
MVVSRHAEAPHHKANRITTEVLTECSDDRYLSTCLRNKAQDCEENEDRSSNNSRSKISYKLNKKTLHTSSAKESSYKLNKKTLHTSSTKECSYKLSKKESPYSHST